MILKFQACLLSLPMLVTNAKRSHVMHSSGRQRREAKLSKQVPIQTNLRAQDVCEEHGATCWWDSDCCSDMECLGAITWQCGHTPGLNGEYCNLVYPCDSDLLCYEGECTDYADILDYGSHEGTCRVGSPSGQLKVMTYNTYLLSCLTGLARPGLDIPCQNSDDSAERVGRMMEWVQTRTEDVIVFQELFNFREEVIEGMVAAGFCHYVVTPFGGEGDGTATFSKYPIGKIDFWDYYDFTGANSDKVPTQVEAIFTDRGIMYAEIKKDGRSHHIYNTHTLSNSNQEEHFRRMPQYLALREVAVGNTNDLVLFAGDMNENKYNSHSDAAGNVIGDKYYQNMLNELNAHEPRMEGNQTFSWDNVENPLAAKFYPVEDKEMQELLDYVLVSNAHLQPSDSVCKILKPIWPENCDGGIECQVSDHYPVTCLYSFHETNDSTKLLKSVEERLNLLGASPHN